MDPNLIMKFIKFTIQMIEEHIEDFLAYLDINRSMFFSSEDNFEFLSFFFELLDKGIG